MNVNRLAGGRDEVFTLALLQSKRASHTLIRGARSLYRAKYMRLAGFNGVAWAQCRAAVRIIGHRHFLAGQCFVRPMHDAANKRPAAARC